MSIAPVNNSPLLPNLGATRTEPARAQNTVHQGLDRAALAAPQARASQAALKPQAPIAGQSTAQAWCRPRRRRAPTRRFGAC